jgi:hypothetical protein
VNDLTTTTTTVGQKVKSFWDTKEGTTGMVVGMLAFLGIGYAAYKIMPFVVNLLENTLYAFGLGIVGITLFYVLVIDGTLRSRAWLMYKMLMRALTYSIIRYDPIGVLREVQKKAQERIKRVDDGRTNVKGQVRQIEATITSFKNDEQALIAKIQYLQNPAHGGPQQNEAEIRTYSAQLGKLRDAEERLTKSYTQVNGFYTQLSRALKALNLMNDDINFQIGLTEREYKAISASAAAWQAVAAAFKGSEEIDSLRTDTMAFIAEDYSNKLGMIDSYMEDAKGFIDGSELTQSMYSDKGLKILEDLNSRNLDIVEATVVPTALPAPSVPLTSMPVGVSATSDYSSLIKK